MGKFWTIYLAGIKTSAASATAYRANFMVANLIDFIWCIAAPLVTIAIYGLGASFPGWTFWEAMLMQALFALSAGISSTLFGGVTYTTMDHIVSGTYESVLLKPMPPLLYLIATNYSMSDMGKILGNGILVGLSATHCTIYPAQIPLFLLMFIAGLAVVSATTFITASASFVWVANSRLDEIRSSLYSFGKYPVGIYPHSIRNFITFVIPFATMGCFSAEILLGRFEPVNLLSLVPVIVFLWFSVWMYNHMIRRYEGVGG
jgi:ABC-2 type transport system permease protein